MRDRRAGRRARLAAPAAVAIDVAAHDPDAQDLAFLQTIRRAGCGWFTTILGPGNPDHAEHFRFDIKPHGAGEYYRI